VVRRTTYLEYFLYPSMLCLKNIDSQIMPLICFGHDYRQ